MNTLPAIVAELRELRLIDAARRDLESTLQWSYDRFGAAAAERYASLIEQSFLDMRRDPFRVGSRRRADTLGANVLTYHLSFSRDRVPGERVQNPRHFLLYRVQADAAVEIGRILHDSRDLPRHVPGEFLDDS